MSLDISGILYIPHCSDGTRSFDYGHAYSLFFISHIVQMELTRRDEIREERKDFISHIVQMEPFSLKSNNIPPKAFISHIVQMELLNTGLYLIINLKLYIPYCSDGTHTDHQSQ